MDALSRNGLRHPFAQYGIQQDVRAGMEVSDPKTTCPVAADGAGIGTQRCGVRTFPSTFNMRLSCAASYSTVCAGVTAPYDRPFT